MKEDISKDEILDEENKTAKKENENDNLDIKEQEEVKESTEGIKQNIDNNTKASKKNKKKEAETIKKQEDVKKELNTEPKRIKIPLIAIILFLIVVVAGIITAAIYFLN